MRTAIIKDSEQTIDGDLHSVSAGDTETPIIMNGAGIHFTCQFYLSILPVNSNPFMYIYNKRVIATHTHTHTHVFISELSSCINYYSIRLKITLPTKINYTKNTGLMQTPTEE